VSARIAGPLQHGSIFTVFNLHQGLDPEAAIEELRAQARQAIKVGFDGVGLSEHHAGFPGYLPNPLQFAGLLLAELPRGFAAALPVIAPLRSIAGLVEEAAWLDARFPGRVVIGLAAGYQEEDFKAFGVAFDERFPLFRDFFKQFGEALSGRSHIESLRRDPALAASVGRIGLAMNTRGLRNVRLAARFNASVSPTQLSVEDYQELFREYKAAGGTGARAVQRWVFLGDPPQDAIETLNRRYADAPGDHTWSNTASLIVPLADHDPKRMASRLLEWLKASDGSALAVRFHLGPMGAEIVREQIARFGAEVVPLLRDGMSELAEAEKRAQEARS
jgi:alkanesulfonate monooxygenase SsuD/methylene tetrahydromethanopterin reductase-like flavin-dependent oxidoreductase (luciferase family)